MENYQKKLDKLIESLGTSRPRLLLHACCAPCSSYCLEYLSEFFDITLFYYNPNISPKTEYEKRRDEAKRLTNEIDASSKILFSEGKYDPESFFEMSKGLENAPEGGERCGKCFELRLDEACKYASENGFDFVTTTLTISPLKNAEVLNSIGRECAKKYNISYLESDFKKKNGYLRSIELSKKYNLYRQNYCGCIFSKRDSTKE